MGRLVARFHLSQIPTNIDPTHLQVQSGKNREAKEPERSPACLAPLPETASLSPTAAKTVKHHTASMMLTFSPGLQHRQPQNVTESADGEERKRRRAEMTVKLWRESATHLMVRVLSSPCHRLSQPLS